MSQLLALKIRISRGVGPGLSCELQVWKQIRCMTPGLETDSLHESLDCFPSVLTGRVDSSRQQPLPPEHSLPPRMLMIKLPLMMVQPRSSWADVTESMVFSPSRRWHTLGQGPRHGVHIKLQKEWRERERSGHTGPHTHTHTPDSVLHRVPSDHKAGCFIHRTGDIWGRRILCCGRLSCVLRGSSSLPGFHLFHTSSTPPPKTWQPKMSPNIVPWGMEGQITPR